MKHYCKQCGNEFKLNRGKQQYCSMACRGKANSGANHCFYKGGSITRQGYRMISRDNKRIFEHRGVMEQILGRPLLPSEHVHHKDGNKLNNSADNLEVCVDAAAHRHKHYTGFRTDTHKQCVKCGEVKLRTDFPAGHKKPGCDPNHTQCKACRAAYYAERWRLGLTSQQRKR